MARRAASTVAENQQTNSDESGDEVTRCICGNEEFVQTPKTLAMHASPGLYVQCERCNVWQHGFCMGFQTEEEVPNIYYCELCEPSFHRLSNRNGLKLSRYRPSVKTEQNEAEPEEKTGAVKPAARVNGKQARERKEQDTQQEEAQQEDTQREDTQQEEASEDSAEKEESAEGDETAQKDKDSEKPEEVEPERDAKESAAKAKGRESREPSLSESPKQEDEHTAVDTPASRKRRSRAASIPSETLYMRNRKRRSREDEILQRVLEESAREAREAEQRRRSAAGLPDVEMEYAVQDEDSEPKSPPSPPAAKARRSAARGGSETSRKGGAGRPAAQEAATSARRGRGGRSVRGGRASGGAASSASASALNGSSAPSSPRRVASGPRRSRPRNVSQRSTLDDMRRRVSAILQFSSRTQDEIIDDQKTRIMPLQPEDPETEEAAKFEKLLRMSQTNLGYLEDLTSQLLQWEEQFGVSGSP